MASPRFQIISDLHLETPLSKPAYSHFSSPLKFPLEADNIFLLGDIGLIADTHPLLGFLRSLLRRNTRLNVFYVLGNHEAYRMTSENAIAKVQTWETTLTKEFGPRFHVLNRTRIDISPTLTLLGCTLWSHVPPTHQREVTAALKDFDEKHGIRDRSVLDHNADHAIDLAWLNKTIAAVELDEPEREIIVLTHHSPTTDARANSKRFPPERALNSAFRTDLSEEKCWTSPNVKVWAFGHTHFSCQFVHAGGEEQRKLVVSNQKGYAYEGGEGTWEVKPVVVGTEEGMWKVMMGAKESAEEMYKRIKISVRGEVPGT
ncbi:hypothetical protein N0V87_007936 [Didymella glomerata]|jgi:predicted phosphodiesterase|uniref:Calcineurin-like phosphoesterase domain-containing protein n=1 Tax=Didymella glomerata TaxID=749621 RepID=A0A9W8WTZ6_9PLEO|nr:hypothetical protein N0V87_007936 [Didymella glomerata]